jgi:hypothetical protein
MKYFIPIDRKTIKKNPNAGNTQSFELGQVDVGLHAYNVDLQILCDDRIMVLEYSATPEIIEEISARILDRSFLNDIEKYTKMYVIEQHRDIIQYSHPPEPEFFYNYEAVDITCSSCGATFPSNELQSDEIYDGETEHYSTEVCPKCGAFDCCDVEYEKINDALQKA